MRTVALGSALRRNAAETDGAKEIAGHEEGREVRSDSDSLLDQGRSGTLPGRGRAKRVCLEVNWSYRDDSEVGDTTRGYRQTLLGMLSRPRRPEDCAAVTG